MHPRIAGSFDSRRNAVASRPHFLRLSEAASGFGLANGSSDLGIQVRTQCELKLGAPFLEVPTIRSVVYWGLFCALNLHFTSRTSS